MNRIAVALDWTPNTNHTGFYVAKELGFYKELGIEIDLVDPSSDNYEITPAKKLALGLVDFAIAPLESVISLRIKENSVNVIAVAAILKEDLSAIVTLKASEINKPSQLDGKVYASYKARYEDFIVNQMVKNDGGKGDMKLIYPEKLGIWNTLLNGIADATWVFMNWEGLEAKNKGIDLNVFKLSDFDIPYGYSPIIIALEENIKTNKEFYCKFIQATKKGFCHAMNHPKESAQILSNHVTKLDLQNIDLYQSQLLTNTASGTTENWGEMDFDKVQGFMQWLNKMGLEQKILDPYLLFINELL